MDSADDSKTESLRMMFPWGFLKQQVKCWQFGLPGLCFCAWATLIVFFCSTEVLVAQQKFSGDVFPIPNVRRTPTQAETGVTPTHQGQMDGPHDLPGNGLISTRWETDGSNRAQATPVGYFPRVYSVEGFSSCESRDILAMEGSANAQRTSERDDGLILAVEQAYEINPDWPQAVSADEATEDIPKWLLSFQCSGSKLLDDSDIIRLAYARSVTRNLLDRESVAASLTMTSRNAELNSSASLYRRFLNLQAERQAMLSAEAALRAHYGVRALRRSIRLTDALIEEMNQQIDMLEAAIEKGISVTDLNTLRTSRLEAQSQRIEQLGELASLRSKLALLIGNQCACCYDPTEIGSALPVPTELCEWVHRIDENRSDLMAYRWVASRLTIENLDVARLASSQITGSAAISTSLGRRWLARLFRRNQATLEKELQARKSQISDYGDSLYSRIVSEVEVAWIAQHSAYDRWELAGQVVAKWTDRIAQLESSERLGLPFPLELLTARIEKLRAELRIVERWNDFHQANIQLRSAAGVYPSAIRDTDVFDETQFHASK